MNPARTRLAAKLGAKALVVSALALAPVLAGGCLTNLNEQKYFDKLERESIALADRVRSRRADIEQAIADEVAEQSPRDVERITYWGAGWDAVRQVVGKEGQLYMRGRVFHESGPASPYWVSYRVPSGESANIEILELRVYGRSFMEATP